VGRRDQWKLRLGVEGAAGGIRRARKRRVRRSVQFSLPRYLLLLVNHDARITINHAGVVDPLVFEEDINALLAEQEDRPRRE
jgi:hypothetical protein